MLRPFYFILISAWLLNSCIEPIDGPASSSPWAETYVPVYAPDSIAHRVAIESNRPISNPGKIFIYQDYLMINIKGEGFHVIDNSNPVVPRPLYFISVPGSNDVAIKDGYLYADNYSDIVVFTIDDNQDLQIINRLKSIMSNQLYPPFRGVNFECVDESKGIVIDWVLSDVQQVNCYRP